MSASRLLVSDIAWLVDFADDPAAAPIVRTGVDLLIEDGRIADFGTGLDVPDAEVVDGRHRVVLPGFVDTHRHLWLTALRALTTDSDLGSYLELVLGTMAPRYTPEDVYTSTYFGALECLDAGVTTVQDFAHVMYSPEHADAAVSALADARVRAVFGYGYPAFDAEARDLADVRRVRAQHFASDHGLLTMELSPAGPSYAPIETVREDWELARELGLPITVHVGAGPVAERPILALQREGLLAAGTVYVHGNSLPDEELALIAESGGAVAIAPAVEAQMGHGAPMIGRLRAAGVRLGLGADVVTATAGDMFTLMRAALVTGHLGAGSRPTTADVLRAATLGGAEVLGLADRIGSLRPGKRADLVLLRADDSNLSPFGHDPVGAVVSSAHPGNIDAVVVDGRVVKRGGVLVGDPSAGVLDNLVSSAERMVRAAAGGVR
ncbi:amidohydrolase family protein [Catenulispora yoronensis]|uniref:Amidohydrolase family protein n=1 Tax=Catenulispora yoronensis TaxID=450799 RepID=A0ABN2TXK7_9ACTN